MGNWRRVEIEGTCEPEHVPALKEALSFDITQPGTKEFHCLMATGGVMSLPNWAAEHIDAVGNLAERDYGISDVVTTLASLCFQAPSLNVRIKIGGDYESDQCVGVVICEGAGKDLRIEYPKNETIREIPPGQMFMNFANALYRR